jgi:FkbM family methyltransferase
MVASVLLLSNVRRKEVSVQNLATESAGSPSLSGVKQRLKNEIGACLIRACNALPVLKKAFCHIGMRARPPAPVVSVQIPGEQSVKFTHVSDNHLTFRLFWLGIDHYEPITTRVLTELIEPGDTFIDAGANIGFFSLVMARLKPGLNVIAFEPNPKLFAILLWNVEVNGFREIACTNLALSDFDGTAKLYLSESDLTASLRSDFEVSTVPPIEVPACTVDSVLRGRNIRGRLIIKVDVEGHEDAFFRGARESIEALKPDIISEVAIVYKENPFLYLRELGYRFYMITDAGIEPTDAPPVPIIRGRYFFPNYLFSTRPPEEVTRISCQIKPTLTHLDLMQTSNCFGPDIFPVPRFEH